MTELRILLADNGKLHWVKPMNEQEPDTFASVDAALEYLEMNIQSISPHSEFYIVDVLSGGRIATETVRKLQVN